MFRCVGRRGLKRGQAQPLWGDVQTARDRQESREIPGHGVAHGRQLAARDLSEEDVRRVKLAHAAQTDDAKTDAVCGVRLSQSPVAYRGERVGIDPSGTYRLAKPMAAQHGKSTCVRLGRGSL